MPFRFNAAAAAGARGARGLAQQTSRRLSLLAGTGGASTPASASAPAAAAVRGGGLGRRPPVAASSVSSSSAAAVAAVARARTPGLIGSGRGTAAVAVAAPAGQTRRLASPAGGTATTDRCSRPGSVHPGASFAFVHPGGWVSGDQRRRGLATTPAAAAEDAIEDAGGNGFGGVPAAADSAGGEQKPVEAAPGTEAASAEGGVAEAVGGDGGSSGGSSSGSASDFLADCNKELREHAQRGQGDKAVALIARMREAGATPTDRSYTSAINACKKGEPQWEQALTLLRETATVGGGVTPNAYHYTAAMKACGKAKEWEQVPLLKTEMDSRGIIPGPPYYNWAIKSAAAASRPRYGGGGTGGEGAGPPGGWDAVKDIVTEMSEKGVAPNQNSYALVRGVRSRLISRGEGGEEGSGGDDAATGSGGGGGGGGGEVVDAELEWALGVLRAIDGAPEPRSTAATMTTEKPEGPPAKAKPKKQQRQRQQQKSQPPLTVATAAADKDGGEIGVGGVNPKQGRGNPSSSDSPPASDLGKGDDRPGHGSLAKFNEELREHATLGEGDKAAALIARMREAGVAPTARSYTSAMNACKHGTPQWEQALALLKETATVGGGVTPNAYHYTAAIKTCGHANQWKKIPALISEMEGRGISPDVPLYNWAIKAASGPRSGPAMRAILTRDGGWLAPEQENDAAGTATSDGSSGDSGGGGGGGGGGRSKSPSLGWEAATGLLRQMSARGVPPSKFTYTLVISACQKDRQPERALAVLREMQDLAAAAGAARAGAEATETASSPTEGAAEEEEDSVDAAAVGEETGSGGGGGGGRGGDGDRGGGETAPNVIHYSSVMSAFVEQPGGWERILALIKEMEAAGVAPNAYTYNSAMMACGRDGRWAEAVAVFRRMAKRGVAPDKVSFLAVIEACRQGGQWALAVAILREMSATPIQAPGAAATMMTPTVEAYTAALTACGNAGQWEVAVGLLREVTDGDAAAAAAAAAVSGDAGVGADVPSAAAAAAAVDDDGDDGDEDYGASGDEEGSGGRRRRDAASAAAAAAEVAAEVAAASAPVLLKADLFLYNAAMEACGSAGQWQRALGLLSEISEIGLSPSVVSYNSAIAACARADQWEKAVALLDEMRVVGLVPVSSTYLPAIEACQRAGEGKLAYALTKERDETQRKMKRHPEFGSMKRGQRKRK